jgi:hypothetical protein
LDQAAANDTQQSQYADAEAAYADHGTIRDLVKRKRDEWAVGREPFLRAAYRNILFYRGQQWIKWDRALNRWRPSRLPKNTPTPVTNIFAATVNAVISVFARIEPRLNFRPGSDEEADDRATADVASRAIEVVEDEVAIRVVRQILATWVGLTGMGWLETGYDPSPIHGTRIMQHEQCPMCSGTQAPGSPVCEACGAPGPLTPAVDEMGEPIGEQVPLGRMYVDVATIFEMFFDSSVTEWTRQRGFLREKSISVDESKARWPHLKDVIRANVTAESWYSDVWRILGPNIDVNQTGRMQHTGATRPINTRVTEQWYQQLPDEAYPDGLLAVVVGREHVAYAGPLPYRSLSQDGENRPFLNTVCFPQQIVPGTGYAKSVADDLALQQAKRNRWESIIEACGMRMGSPVWLKPNGANVTNLTGDPGNVISYNAVGPNAAKPERIQGQGIPVSFIQRIDKIDSEFEELAATFDVVKGQRPEGISAGIALQILQERNLSRYGPLFILWEQAWSQWARMALEIFREFVTEPRLLKIQGRDGRWQVQKFLGADLKGQVDVTPEAASSTPRSSLLDKAEMEQLAAMHVIDITDPEIRFKFLEVYGRTNLTPAMAADTKNAIMENEAFQALAQHPTLAQTTPENIAVLQQLDYPTIAALLEQDGIKLPKVRGAIDDHSIHSRELRAFAKSESFHALPEIVQLLVEKHGEWHQSLMMAQAQALQGGAPMAGGFMASPAPRQSAMSSSSSGARMQGDANEMEHQVVNGGV